MANHLSFFCIFTISIFLLSSILYQATAAESGNDDLVDEHSVKDNPKKTKRHLKQKLSTFTFYWHDVYSSKPTAVSIINPLPQYNSTGFGTVIMIDDKLTQGPNSTSKELGRAQGFYAGASQEELRLLMVMNFVFTTGKYKGSTIAIMGSNLVLSKVREMSVVGGTGLFRFAHGYASVQTNWYDSKTGDAIVQYDVSVIHYT